MRTQEEYIKAVIKSNLSLGYTLEEISSDMKEAAKRHFQRELYLHKRMYEYMKTTQGLLEIKRQLGIE